MTARTLMLLFVGITGPMSSSGTLAVHVNAPSTSIQGATGNSPLLSYDGQPLRFEPNGTRGAQATRFTARGKGYILSIVPQAAQYSLTTPTGERLTVTMELQGANPAPPVSTLGELPGYTNYLVGGDPRMWRTAIPGYERVRYSEVYPGISLVYLGSRALPKHDFIVEPGADVNRIRFAFAGAQSVRINEGGDLVIGTRAATILQVRPTAYQDIDGKRTPVDVRYTLISPRLLGYAVGRYDVRRSLVIDPPVKLSYSTYVGTDDNDFGVDVGTDSFGNSFVIGSSETPDVPSSRDIFVAKFTPSGTMAFLTYIGGSSSDDAAGIAVNTSGEAYVVGSTLSTNFPLLGSYDTCDQPRDIFVLRLNSAGTGLIYGTCIGGTSADSANDIGLDPTSGVAWIVGNSLSSDFPTVNAYDATFNTGTGGNGVIIGLDTSVSGTASLLYSSFFGQSYLSLRSLSSVAVSGGRVFVGGQGSVPTTANAYDQGAIGLQGFVSKLDPTLDGEAQLLYSTYLEGGGSENDSDVLAIFADVSERLYVTGRSNMVGFPTTPQAYNRTVGGVFVAIIDTIGSGTPSLLYSTFVGAGIPSAIDVDTGGVYVVGYTVSSSFPITSTAFDRKFLGDGGEGFVVKLDLTLSSLLFSSFLGGRDDDFATGIAIDPGCTAHIAGATLSNDFPTTRAAYDTSLGYERRSTIRAYDGFLTKAAIGCGLF